MFLYVGRGRKSVVIGFFYQRHWGPIVIGFSVSERSGGHGTGSVVVGIL